MYVKINFSAFHANLMKFENWQKFISIYLVVIFIFIIKTKNKSTSIWMNTKWLRRRRRQSGKLTTAKNFCRVYIVLSAISINFLFHANVENAIRSFSNRVECNRFAYICLIFLFQESRKVANFHIYWWFFPCCECCFVCCSVLSECANFKL